MARHTIRIGEMGDFEVDEDDGRLYWKGKGVVLEQKVSLDGWTFVLAVLATVGTLVSAAWPIVQYFWFPSA